MIDGKTVVGVVPWCYYHTTENQYDDKYFFTETYGQRILDAGMIPMAILPVDYEIQTPVLSMCDSFVIIGGKGAGPYHMQVLDHAMKTGKKVLGICLGCQQLQIYFTIKKRMEDKGDTRDIGQVYREDYWKRRNDFLTKVEGHQHDLLPYDDKSSVKHKVLVKEDSMIAKILGTTELLGASFHIYCIGEAAPELRVTAYSEDGIIEAVEYQDQFIGTQFHPDVDREYLDLFRFLEVSK